MNKAYRGKSLVQNYDDRHFGGRSGAWVFQKDLNVILDLLGDAKGVSLDVPCGTGIYSEQLKDRGFTVIACDLSMDMLEITRNRLSETNLVNGDITGLPFPSSSLDAVIAIRLFQHLPQAMVSQILGELRRVIKPAGKIIFDTFSWTPRPARPNRRGIFTYSNRTVELMLEKVELRLHRKRSQYLFSPIAYRKLPFGVVACLGKIENWVPQSLRLRTFWECSQT